MQNLKIDLTDILHNEDEKQEAVCMLNKIGYKTGYKSVDFYRYLYACGSGYDQYSRTIQFGDNAKTFRRSGFKEITLAELRGMAKPMQEYLNTETYEYKLAHTKPDGEWVCIPEGAIEARLTPSGSINFINIDSDYMNRATGGEWVSTHRFKHDDAGHKIIWQRPTQPEALPFIDDNQQSLNEQYAEIEQVRQQSIDATLAERGSRYGDFESVAETTRALMRVLDNGDTFNELSASQHEALHMICSKMARIVNGDPDYRDNWHDIGGYAKLIENNI